VRQESCLSEGAFSDFFSQGKWECPLGRHIRREKSENETYVKGTVGGGRRRFKFRRDRGIPYRKEHCNPKCREKGEEIRGGESADQGCQIAKVGIKQTTT